MPQTHTAVRDAIKAFETATAVELAQFAAADSVSDAGLKSNLAKAGITAKITATCDNLNIEVQIPDAPGVPSGQDAGDLKDAALTRHAEGYLTRRKAAVWTAIKSLANGGSIKPDQAVTALRNLGYADTSLPSTKATVTADLARGRNEGYDSVSFTLPGEGHTVESVTETLIAAGLKLNPAESFVMAAFATAELSKDRQAVRNVRVDSALTWPAKSEFHTA